MSLQVCPLAVTLLFVVSTTVSVHTMCLHSSNMTHFLTQCSVLYEYWMCTVVGHSASVVVSVLQMPKITSKALNMSCEDTQSRWDM